MGKYLGSSLILLFLLFFLAWLWAEPSPARNAAPEPEEEGKANISSSPQLGQEEPLSPVGGELDSSRTLRVLINGAVQEMDMATYLAGVVRAEMPATFAPEALKAQAVAARTYTYYKMANGGSANHPQADTCDNINCCKAYRAAEDAAASWGEQAKIYEEKIRAAVRETDGECVLYEGQPVLAVFHSSSAGETRDAQEVWSSARPYLQSVTSPEGADTVPNYHSAVSFEAEELKTVLQTAFPAADLTGRCSDWFTNIQQLPNGFVSEISVGGVSVGGNELRTVLGLRSACFTMAFEGDTVTFSVTGYGHGVGMSQYGANVLAADGMDYREILAWYYTDTTVGAHIPEK